MGASEASVIYIYIYIYRLNEWQLHCKTLDLGGRITTV